MPWLPGISFDFAGIILPFGDAGTVGVSATMLHTDEMEVTTPQQQMGTGETFTASSIALGSDLQPLAHGPVFHRGHVQVYPRNHLQLQCLRNRL